MATQAVAGGGVCRRAGPLPFVTVVAASRLRDVRKGRLRPIRIRVVAGRTLRVVRLRMEWAVQPGFVSVTTDAGGRKWRMNRYRIGECPVVHDVTAGTVPAACGRLMGWSRGSQIAVASIAGARYRGVCEVGLCPVRIVPVTARTFALSDLSVEDRRLPRFVLVTG